MITDHWFRADAEGRCALRGCGMLQAAHVESVGEWSDPRHWFRPVWALSASCALCGRHPQHSTHRLSRKNRSLWLWPHVRDAVCHAKDKAMRSPRCRAFSPRLRLPCLRAMTNTCAGECDKHHGD